MSFLHFRKSKKPQEKVPVIPRVTELAIPVQGPTPSLRRIEEIRGSDIRYLGFSGGTEVEIWRSRTNPHVYESRTRIFSYPSSHGVKLEGAEPGNELSFGEMDALLQTLLDAGLGTLYSSYINYDIIDGNGWGLEIMTTDGYLWSWGGLNAYPEEYMKILNALAFAVEGNHINGSPLHGDSEEDKPELWHIYKDVWYLDEAADSLRVVICRHLKQDLLTYLQRHPSEDWARAIASQSAVNTLALAHQDSLEGKTAEDILATLLYLILGDDSEQQTMMALSKDGTLKALLLKLKEEAEKDF